MIEFSDKTKYWFFADEIKLDSSIQIKPPNKKIELEAKRISLSIIAKSEMELTWDKRKEGTPITPQEIIYMANPINIIKWLLYSLKDVF